MAVLGVYIPLFKVLLVCIELRHLFVALIEKRG